MNLPNKLTVSRLLLTGLMLAALLLRLPGGDTAALVLFVLASLTDFYDGRIARARRLITNFGILLDPLADKVLVCATFIALMERGALHHSPEIAVRAWMVIVIVARELAITGLRLLAAAQQVVLAAERYGKHKTISQMVALTALLVLQARHEWPAALQAILCPWLPWLAWATLWLAVLLTLSSGGVYLWRNRAIFLKDL